MPKLAAGMAKGSTQPHGQPNVEPPLQLNIGHSKGREVKIKPKSEHCDGHGRVYLHWNCIPRREDWMWQ